MKKISHLDDKQIIEAVIDENGLDRSLRRHLSECPACRAQKEALQGRLARFGQISRGDTPENFRKPKISEKSPGAFAQAWKIRPALGLGAVFVVLALLLSPLAINRDQLFTKAVVYREMVQDQKFMAEVERLEENPLPAFYVDIAGQGVDKPNTPSPGPGAKNNDRPSRNGGSRNA